METEKNSVMFSSFKWSTWEQSLNINIKKQKECISGIHHSFELLNYPVKEIIWWDVGKRKQWVFTCLPRVISLIWYRYLNIFYNKLEQVWNCDFHNKYFDMSLTKNC